ncbi:YcnI family protein [Streptomyces sp. DSM 44915]|uniref:YcnI family protein n=1 Tax=Streptomyces chisholmiae TaxID=3075540 RepID=A0ABU2JQ99_9ACTN|nr:YcnI family protein [Streptomyces sp. DSM 44915]MDT0267166.1 YcnI family protein [Streptomyces sp. DSM 44915]
MNRVRKGVSAAAVAAGAVALLALATPAQAHVSIDPAEAEAGGYQVLNIKVPNERDNASTVELELHLDTEHPMTSVMPQPVPGWEIDVQTIELDEPVEVHGGEVTEVPSVITWSGGEITPGTFQQFPLSVGPLPEGVDQLFFKALQTYDNDEVVRWIEEPAEGGEEPAEPAAVLRLTPGGDDAHGHGHGDQAAADTADAQENEQAAAADDDGNGADTTARVLGGVGIAVGVAGVVFGVLANRRRDTA